MPDGIDAAVDHVQASGRDAMANRPAAEAQLEQLRSGDDPMLVRGEAGDLWIERSSV